MRSNISAFNSLIVNIVNKLVPQSHSEILYVLNSIPLSKCFFRCMFHSNSYVILLNIWSSHYRCFFFAVKQKRKKKHKTDTHTEKKMENAGSGFQLTPNVCAARNAMLKINCKIWLRIWICICLMFEVKSKSVGDKIIMCVSVYAPFAEIETHLLDWIYACGVERDKSALVDICIPACRRYR